MDAILLNQSISVIATVILGLIAFVFSTMRDEVRKLRESTEQMNKNVAILFERMGYLDKEVTAIKKSMVKKNYPKRSRN